MDVNDLVRLLSSRPEDDDGTLIEPLYSALYYATLLLRALRDERDEYRVLRFNIEEQSFIRSLAKRVEPEVSTFFSGGKLAYKSSLEHEQALQPLARVLRDLERNEDNRPLLLARAVAVAINDTALGDLAMEQFSNYYSVPRPVLDGGAPTEDDPATVQPGDPVPTCFGVFGYHEEDENSRQLSFGTNPLNLPAFRNPDRLPSVVLAPLSVAAFDLQLNFDYNYEMLNLQQGSTVIATFHPTKELAAGDFSFRRVGEDKERFFNVRTRCAGNLEDDEPAGLPDPPFGSRDEFRGRLSDGIRAAARHGANLFLIPELVLDPSDAEPLFKTWREVIGAAGPDPSIQSRQPQLMIPGSWHEVDEIGTRVNVVEVWGGRPDFERPSGGDRGARVVKTVPYAHRLDGATTVENINTPRRPPLRIFCSDNATMMIFVCIDFLLDELRDLARDLYVSLVIIPSMSGKSRVFTELMIGHVAATEAVVIFLDSLQPTDDPHRGVVMVRHPDRRRCLAINNDSVPEVADARGVVVTDLDPGADPRHVFVAM